MTFKTRLALASGIASLILSGCASTMASAIASSGALGDASTFRAPMSRADTGQRISAGGGLRLQYEMQKMAEGLPRQERHDLYTAMIGLARYESCLLGGVYSPKVDSEGRFKPPSRRIPADQCASNPNLLLGIARNDAGKFHNTGSPTDGIRAKQARGQKLDSVLRGAIGDFTPRDVRTVGGVDGMEIFYNSGGYAIEGLTRTEIMNRFSAVMSGQSLPPVGSATGG